MMKCIMTLIVLLQPLLLWAINVETYTEPQPNWPEAFDWVMKRYDYKSDVNGNDILVNVQTVRVAWDPTFVWESTVNKVTTSHYGQISAKNIYTSPYTDTEVLNINFENRLGRNFRWDNEECSLLTLSFTSYTMGRTNQTAKNAAKYPNGSSFTYAWVNSCNTSVKSQNYFTGEDTPYSYGGGTPVELSIDIPNRMVTIAKPWGLFVTSGSSGGGSSRVLEYFDHSRFIIPPLEDIIDDPTTPTDVTIGNDMIAVKVVPEYDNEGNLIRNLLYCKDYGKYSSPDVNTDGKIDFMARTLNHSADSYDQSNWVALIFDDITSESFDIYQYEGQIIKGGTITGTWGGGENNTITLSILPTVLGSSVYTPNLYVTSSFNDEYSAPESRYFFIRPKPQEYCEITWATYDAATDAFYIPQRTPKASGGYHNDADMNGGFYWNRKYLEPAIQPIDGATYTFKAIVNKTESGTVEPIKRTKDVDIVPPKVSSPVSGSYVVMPLSLEQITTGLNDITEADSSSIVSRKYVNLLGVESDRPFKGTNIIIESHENGGTTITKSVF